MSDLRTHIVYNMDAHELLSRLDPGTAGMVLLDPPAYLGGDGDTPESTHIDALFDYYDPLAAAISRALRPGGAVVFLGDPQSIAAWEIAALLAGMRFSADLTVLWDSSVPTRGSRHGVSIESMTSVVRWHTKPGLRYHTEIGMTVTAPSNVILTHRVPPADRVNVMQRPVELFNVLISLLSEPDDLVVDPFCGSGASCIAAEITHRDWVACDSDQGQVEIARRRTQQAEVEAFDLAPIFWWTAAKMIPIGH